MNDCCLTPNEQFIRNAMARVSCIQWNDDDVRFAIDRYVCVDFIALAHYNSARIDMSLHSEAIYWFRTNQSGFSLLSVAYFAEKQQIPILLCLVWPKRDSNSWSTVLEENTLTITPPIWFSYLEINQLILSTWIQHDFTLVT